MIVVKGGMENKTVEGKKSILVGIQMDSDGRDLLNWAIERSWNRDRVVAVHVYRKSDLCNSSVLSITRSLDNCLAEYQVLCDLKQVIRQLSIGVSCCYSTLHVNFSSFHLNNWKVWDLSQYVF